MSTVPAASDRPEAPLFTDGLGDRVVAVDGGTGDLLQILKLRPALLGVPSFEFALRERTARLANFRHAYFARVRRVDRHPAGLAMVADHVEGTRLSEILRVAEERRLHLDLNAALCLIRQLVPAVALLHENARDVAHGLLAPERLIVTPHARLVIAEHVLGSAVEQLQYGRERLWQELRVALPQSAGAPRFDHRADVTGIGLVSLALVLGRPLRADEFPHRLPALLNEVRATSAMGEEQPLPPSLRGWLAGALQLDLRRAYASATEALSALEDALSEDTGFVAAPVALETFLSRYVAALLEAPVPVAPKLGLPPAAPVAPLEPPAPPVSFVSPVLAATSAAPPKPPAIPLATGPAAAVHPPAAPARPGLQMPIPPAVPRNPAADPPRAVTTPAAGVPSPAPPAARIAQPAVVEDDAPPARDLRDLLDEFDGLGPADHDREALFDVEREPPAPGVAPSTSSPAPPRRTRGRLALVAALLVTAAGGAGVYAMRMYRAPSTSTTGTFAVQTNPPGVQVFVDGVSRGLTPARLSLSGGAHIVELRGRGVPRVIPISVTPGAEVSQYLELPQTPTTGSLLVQSTPAGARVSIDGIERGVAPISVADLEPGAHEIVLQGDGPAVTQRVVIQPGVTASVLAPIPVAAAGPVSGWVSFKAPVSIEVREGGRLVGTSDTDRIMMAAGRHTLELANETLGFQATRVVQVPAGKLTSQTIELPQGTVNLNASPWAEVWIDGARVGETPIGNLAVTIGPHEIVFRHPQFGEKRQAVSVTLKGPVRLSVNMR